MSEYILENRELRIRIKDTGAELTSISDSLTKTEYLWNGNPDFWKRNSPILFPIVGSLKNKSYIHNSQCYPMPQHGFARDMQFDVIEKRADEIWFLLEADDETKKHYPFHFALEIGYRLNGRQITVMWKVTNLDTDTMYFSIGGHPAFLCPLNDREVQSECFIIFDTVNPLRYLTIDEQGLAVKKPAKDADILDTEQGCLPVTPHLFDRDALIFENSQSHAVSLAGKDRKAYVTVSFNSPLFGLWSPAGKNAPFICIEPWYGRCDSRDFNGTLAEREWGNKLETGKTFCASYTIDIASDVQQLRK